MAKVVKWDTDLINVLVAVTGRSEWTIRKHVQFLARIVDFKLPKYRRTEK